MSDERERRELVKELANAVSTQANVANRAWLAMMTVALFAVLPRVPAKGGNVSLPFNLGEVDPVRFHAVALSIFVVLVITFAGEFPRFVCRGLFLCYTCCNLNCSSGGNP